MSCRDLNYEKENIERDYQYPEGGIKCKNHLLCEAVLPRDWHEYTKTYLCGQCGSWSSFGFGWDELEFKYTDEDCAICNENKDLHIKFPVNCGHWFCIECTKNIMFCDETRYHLSPVSFGCPPCPNSCRNPIRGKQCYCIEYDEIQEKWKRDYPEKHEEYNNAENKSIEYGEFHPGSVYGSKKCPFCRKKYERI